MKKVTLLFAAIVFFAFSQAQAPYLQWSTTYGGSEDDYAFEIEVLMDGFLIAGHTKSFGNGNDTYDFYLIRTDEMGNILWTKTYGGAQDEVLLSCSQTHDGGFILSGYTKTWAQGISDGYIVRVDKNGDTLWTKNIGGLTTDQFACGIPTNDQGFVFTGFSSVYMMGDQMYIVKTDHNGDTLWTQLEGGGHQDYGKCIIQTSDNGYASLGHTWSQGNESMGYLVRLNQSGHVTWWNAFGDTGEEYCRWFDQNEDNSFTIAGSTSSWGNGSNDFWLVQTNVDGFPINWNMFGGVGSETLSGASRDVDGGILMAGDTWTFGADVPNMYFLKTNTDGDTLWTRYWGSQNWEYAYDIKPTFDGGFVVVGREYSITTGDNNIILLRYGPYPSIYNTLQHHNNRDLPILDNQGAFDTMTVQVPAGATILGATVYIDTVLHGEIHDLIFTLSYAGITDTLIDRPMGGGQNIFDAALHPAASCDAKAGIAPMNGIYRPYQLPNGYFGRSGGNEWVLGVYDAQTGNEGTLEAWGLRVFYESMVGIADGPDEPNTELHVYPNPSFGDLTIRYRIPVTRHASRVTSINLYSIDGRKICEIFHGKKTSGEFEMNFDVSNLPAGVYFVRMVVGDKVAVRKLVIDK